MRKADRTTGGFSIFEFTVALIVCAIGALFMAPLYYKVVFNYQATAYTNNLVATLNYARTQALRRSRPVSVCSSDDGHHCAKDSWSRGYIVFVDDGPPGAQETGDLVLKAILSGNPRITVTLTGGRFIRFNPNGSLMASTSSAVTPPIERFITNLGRWLTRISPIAVAHASGQLNGLTENAPEKFFSTASAVTHGTFRVCIKHVGRAVTLSYSGHVISTVVQCD